MPSKIKERAWLIYGARFIYWLSVLNFADLIAKYLPFRSRPQGRKRIVFFRFDGIGDYVIWSRTFRAIDKAYPSSEFERILVGNEFWKGLAESEPFFDTKLFYSRTSLVFRPFYRFRAMRAVRRLGADIAVNPRTSREFVLTDSLVRVSGAAERIGSAGLANRMTSLQQKISDRWYTKLASAPEPGEHELSYWLRMLGEVNGSSPASPDPQLPRIDLGGDTAVLFIGAQKSLKVWPMENFAAAAKHISDKYGLRILVCGGPAERKAADRFAEIYGEGFEDLVGRASLPEFENLVAASRIVISGDTGAGHVAAALGRPFVLINPGTSEGRYFPYPPELLASPDLQVVVTNRLDCFGCDWYCIYEKELNGAAAPCVSGVTVGQVNDAVDRLMALDLGERETALRAD